MTGGSTKSRERRIDELLTFLVARDDTSTLEWFDRELPCCMELVPDTARQMFLSGAYRRAIELVRDPGDRSLYADRQVLKTRGWTSHLISTFLQEHDMRAIDGPPVKLYLLSRVESIEQTREFRGAKQAKVKRG